jgi:hypothetical protein
MRSDLLAPQFPGELAAAAFLAGEINTVISDVLPSCLGHGRITGNHFGTRARLNEEVGGRGGVPSAASTRHLGYFRVILNLRELSAEC